MLPFVFILTVMSETGPTESSVKGANMTGEQCAAAVEIYVESNPNMTEGFPSCEPYIVERYAVEHKGQMLEMDLCPTEDSDNCVWDAMLHGNGMGQSFYTLEGQTYYLD